MSCLRSPGWVGSAVPRPGAAAGPTRPQLHPMPACCRLTGRAMNRSRSWAGLAAPNPGAADAYPHEEW